MYKPLSITITIASVTYKRAALSVPERIRGLLQVLGAQSRPAGRLRLQIGPLGSRLFGHVYVMG